MNIYEPTSTEIFGQMDCYNFITSIYLILTFCIKRSTYVYVDPGIYGKLMRLAIQNQIGPSDSKSDDKLIIQIPSYSKSDVEQCQIPMDLN